MTTISQSTVDDLRAAVEAIAIDPKSFGMRMWACGSTMCFAGHLAFMRGFTPIILHGECRSGQFQGMVEVQMEPVRYSLLGLSAGTIRGEGAIPICELILKEFGLDSTQQESLFYLDNWPYAQQSRYDDGDRVGALREVVELFIAEYGPKPEHVEQCPELLTETAK